MDDQEVLVPAWDEQEALLLARNILGHNSELHARTIRPPGRGWLGVRRRQGLYQIRRWDRPGDNSRTGATVAATNADTGETWHFNGPSPAGEACGAPPDKAVFRYSGQASVRRGVLMVKGRAIIIVPSGVRLRVNGTLRHGTIVVRETDEVQAELPASVPPAGYEIAVAPDEMQATLLIHPGHAHRLQDAMPACPLVINVEEVRIPPPNLSVETVLSELGAQGVTHGIELPAIVGAIQRLPTAPVVVASCTPARPGSEATITTYFAEHVEWQETIREDGTMDYRGLLQVPTAEEGQLLASKVSGTPGEAGVTVRGGPIPPKAVQEVVLVAGKGARLDSSGLTAFAATTGRPTIERGPDGRHVVRVLPVLTHGDVDLASGNLRFAGDIVVQGNVADSMSVIAGGNLTVYGSVSRAYLEAAEDLCVLGNAFNSTLVAGGRAAFYLSALPLLERIASALDKLQLALAQLKDHPILGSALHSDGRFRQLVNSLVETSVRELPGLMHSLHERLSATEWSDDLSTGLKEMLRMIQPDSNGQLFAGKAELEAFSLMVMETIELAGEAPRDNAKAVVRYLHSCQLDASGDVEVGNRGSYYSKCSAGGRLRSSGPVLGGRVYGHLGVEVSEAGSEIGVATELATSTAGTIRIGRVYPDVLLRVGRRTHGVNTVRDGLRVRSVENDLRGV